MHNRLLGEDPWRRVAYTLATLALLVVALSGVGVSLYFDNAELEKRLAASEARERERTHSADVSATVGCYRQVANAPAFLQLLELLDANAEGNIRANVEARRLDPDSAIDNLRARTIRQNQAGRIALERISSQVKQQTPKVEACDKQARQVGLNPVAQRKRFNLPPPDKELDQ